ncbi:MAG: hypothetical protein HY398_01795 [Candidatus Doudnabacteria bacterium]|nr:hypothetical protein [Candidatus Doudnabacteria bacterium]
MSDAENYKSLLSEIIRKQMDILGPDIALRKAKNVAGLSVNDDGSVSSLSGDAQTILQSLVSEYISLSGEIVKNILGPVFAKYPDIKLNL